jgi:hypothetical protein
MTGKEAPQLDAALQTWVPDIVGLAQYAWNSELNLSYARRLNARDPDVMVVAGGQPAPRGRATSRIPRPAPGGRCLRRPTISHFGRSRWQLGLLAYSAGGRVAGMSYLLAGSPE